MKIPIYATGTGKDKYVNGFGNSVDVDKYYQDYHNSESLFGMDKRDFGQVFTDDIHPGTAYFFPLVIRFNNIGDILPEYQIPDSVLSDIAAKRCKILGVCPHEGFDWHLWLQWIDIVKTKYNLNYHNFVVLDGNMYSHPEVTSVYYNAWEKGLLSNNIPDALKRGAHRIIDRHPRSKQFIFLNRRPHVGRIAAMTMLYPYHENGNVSLHLLTETHAGYFNGQESQMSHWYPTVYQQYIDMDLRSKLPIMVDDGVDAEHENPVHDYDSDKFHDVFLQIVAETTQITLDNESRVFFSEKIFKPVLAMQPFVLLAQHQSLRAFKELGFRTFGDFIDESYDDIADDEQRLIVATQAAIEFFDRPLDVLHDVMIEMLPILTHNISHLQYRCMTSDSRMNTALKAALKY